MPIEALAPDRHLDLIEGVLHHVIGVQLVDPPHDDLDVRLLRLGEQEELGPRERLEAGQAEEGRLEDFETREGGGARDAACGGSG
ncbi:hypothetical protein MMC14_008402 [Varicellaria rhodocarpa]|nr:hypothetical protein [Varicellaria rhodocarpa]